MIINSVKLSNIRSYLEETISFPQGSLLLSGDIGSGKTTLLLAIEFAIFGFIKGTVSGTSLLRHGKSQGYVELDFTIDNKHIIIKRNLKRGASVQQEAGYIVLDDVKTEGTAVELKSKVLELLGYPEELVTRSKSLIFRYTVYTPQEEMNHILYENKDERLDTLRRIFNIEKYKVIKENLITYMRELKNQKAILETRIEGLDELREESKQRADKLKELDKNIKELEAKIKSAAAEKHEKKKRLEDAEKDIKEFSELRKQLSVLEMEFNKNKDYMDEKKEEIFTLNNEVAKDEKAIGKLEIAGNLEKKRAECLEEMDKCEEKVRELEKTETEYKLTKRNSNELINKIAGMDKCPTCKQKVTEKHIQEVKQKEGDKIKLIEENEAKLLKMKEKYGKLLVELEKDKDRLDKEIKQFEINKIRIDHLEKKKEKIKRIGEEMQKLEKKNSEIGKDMKEREKKVLGFIDLDMKYGRLKEELEQAINNENNLEVQKGSALREKSTLAEVQEKLEQQIKEKLAHKEKLDRTKQALNWLDKYLMSIVILMERQILLKIYHEFNGYFCEWFDLLIEDENLNVRLDEDFAPVIQQNGYETYLENLSGGEKTSLALAYRLALNKVINDFVGNIKTRDLIILDEPTDGFSSEQLDRIRDVLAQLNMKQVIIVSHEAKLESYVDNIIRVVKEHHVSRVLA